MKKDNSSPEWAYFTYPARAVALFLALLLSVETSIKGRLQDHWTSQVGAGLRGMARISAIAAGAKGTRCSLPAFDAPPQPHRGLSLGPPDRAQHVEDQVGIDGGDRQVADERTCLSRARALPPAGMPGVLPAAAVGINVSRRTLVERNQFSVLFPYVGLKCKKGLQR